MPNPGAWKIIVCTLVLAGVGVPWAVGQEATPPVRAWAETTIDDLHFIRATLRENHPGPMDTLNPWFRRWYRQGFDEALALAHRAENYAGYYFAIQHYMQGFQDGHLGALSEDLLADPHLSFRWPGFVVAYRGGKFEVVETEAAQVPLGATLVGCNGQPAEALGRSRLQAYHGLWSVRGARSHLAPLLFVDAGNPFLDLLTMCRWQTEAQVIAVPLTWRALPADTLQLKVREARRQEAPDFGVRTFGAGVGYWISLPSFNLGAEAVQQGMDSVRAVLARDGDRMRAATAVVIDVRGNGGGASSLGQEIVEALWGPAVLAAAQPQGVYVDWRASAGNARFLRRVNLPRLEERYGAEDSRTVRYRTFIEALEAAVDRGDVFYRPGGASTPEAPRPDFPRHAVAAPVFFLTDHACFSACLDFADLMRRIPGVVHIGLETRADAVYIDNRADYLPSGLGRVGFSMKVFRNRPRGHNQSYTPAHTWTEDIRADGALQQWVLQLARTPAR